MSHSLLVGTMWYRRHQTQTFKQISYPSNTLKLLIQSNLNFLKLYVDICLRLLLTIWSESLQHPLYNTFLEPGNVAIILPSGSKNEILHRCNIFQLRGVGRVSDHWHLPPSSRKQNVH